MHHNYTSDEYNFTQESYFSIPYVNYCRRLLLFSLNKIESLRMYMHICMHVALYNIIYTQTSLNSYKCQSKEKEVSDMERQTLLTFCLKVMEVSFTLGHKEHMLYTYVFTIVHHIFFVQVLVYDMYMYLYIHVHVSVASGMSLQFVLHFSSLLGISVLALLMKRLFFITLSMFLATPTLLHQSVAMQIWLSIGSWQLLLV